MKWRNHGRIYRLKGVPYEICAGCGLVGLRNEISQWCMARGCDHTDSAAYPTALRRLGPQ